MTAFMLVLLALTGRVSASDAEAPRVWAGLDLFPSLLAADENIAEKQGPDGKLLLLLMVADEKKAAEEMALHIEKVGKIRRTPIRVEIAESLKDYENKTVAGIFLTQKMRSEFDSVLQYGKDRHVIVFSPFEGDVERGASGGIIISDRFVPYINLKTLNASKIDIRPLFRRIAERYE
jgi:hypothetical protein